MGSDSGIPGAALCEQYFNPRPRMGSDNTAIEFRTCSVVFQSTPPAWGATFLDFDALTAYSYFNPRPPHGERLEVCTFIFDSFLFQSTPPAWGATSDTGECDIQQFISIHAPRMGSDQKESDAEGTHVDFNPRPPHGERRLPRLKSLC